VGVPNTKLGMDIDDDKVAKASDRDTDKNVVRRATAVNDGAQRSCLALHEMKYQLVYVLLSAPGAYGFVALYFLSGVMTLAIWQRDAKKEAADILAGLDGVQRLSFGAVLERGSRVVCRGTAANERRSAGC
jgi:hypothetical protein